MTHLRFLTDLPIGWPLAAVVVATAAAWWLAHRETRDLASPRNWLLPTLRAAAVALIVSMLLEPSLQHRTFLGEPSRLRVWLDGSASMQETDAAGDDALDGGRNTRYQRSVELIAGGDIPRLETWAGQGSVEVHRWSGEASVVVWQSSPTDDLPPVPPVDAWLPDAWSLGTSLVPPLRASLPERANDDAAAERREPVLLLTDGRHNQGPSPVDLLANWSETWQREQTPVWVLGMGSSLPPPRMTIRGVTTPAELFRSDRLEGRIDLADHRPVGELWQLSVRLDTPGDAGRPLWAERIESSGEGLREVAFGFPLEPVVGVLMGRDAVSGSTAATFDSLAVPLLVEVTPLVETAASAGETAGQVARQLVGVTTRRQRVLLLDGRSRWETRYLRNALERDPRWEVDAFLMKPRQPPQWFAQQAESRPFPRTAEDWLEYDLVITGEVEPTADGVQSLRLLREAVERGGTGWVVIDGQRDTWGRAEFAPLRELLPVQRQPVRGGELPGAAWQPVVEDQASDLGALTLGDGTPGASRAAWDRLPGLVNVLPVRLLPGAETLVEVVRGITHRPLISTRLYGGGRVVHLASDETWRWRYEVADEIHQRLWNQLARYAMRIPFSVRNDYAALDSGDVTVAVGQPVPVRALLKDSSGLPAEATLVQAVAVRDGQAVSSVSLVADPVFPGLFRGQWDALPPGTYAIRLQATGFPAEALALETSVQVVAPPTPESIDVTRDEAMLRQIAESTGGRYVPEQRAAEMWDLIELERTGRVVETVRDLWQSGWWLAVVMGLLAAEWWLRKKAGLI